MHPHGEELVACVAGRITLHQEIDLGEDRRRSARGRSGDRELRRAMWHTADVDERVTALFVTAPASAPRSVRALRRGHSLRCWSSERGSEWSYPRLMDGAARSKTRAGHRRPSWNTSAVDSSPSSWAAVDRVRSAPRDVRKLRRRASGGDEVEVIPRRRRRRAHRLPMAGTSTSPCSSCTALARARGLGRARAGPGRELHRTPPQARAGVDRLVACTFGGPLGDDHTEVEQAPGQSPREVGRDPNAEREAVEVRGTTRGGDHPGRGSASFEMLQLLDRGARP